MAGTPEKMLEYLLETRMDSKSSVDSTGELCLIDEKLKYW